MTKVLVVDDEEMITNAVANCMIEISDGCYDVSKAYSAEEAVAVLEASPPDLVISDICMPGMDGMELMDMIRNHLPSCHIILLTAHEEFEYARRAAKYDKVKMVLKSEGFDELARVVLQTANTIQEEHQNDRFARMAGEQLKKLLPEVNEQLSKEIMGILNMKKDSPLAFVTDMVREIREEEMDSHPAPIISYLILYIKDNIGSDLSLATLADSVHFHPSYLSRLFKKETGMTLTEFITNVRVERAKELLSDVKYRIKDVSEMLGFDSPKYFASVFKKRTGLLPNEWKNNVIF